jgi:hypothetical protein
MRRLEQRMTLFIDTKPLCEAKTTTDSGATYRPVTKAGEGDWSQPASLLISRAARCEYGPYGQFPLPRQLRPDAHRGATPPAGQHICPLAPHCVPPLLLLPLPPPLLLPVPPLLLLAVPPPLLLLAGQIPDHPMQQEL